MQWDDAVHGVIVLVGGGWERRQIGKSSEWRRDDDGVAFGGGIVLALYLIDEGYVSLRVFDAEFRVGHEVVDGAAGLRCLQTLIGRHAVSEGVHNTDLKDEGEHSNQEEPGRKVWRST